MARDDLHEANQLLTETMPEAAAKWAAEVGVSTADAEAFMQTVKAFLGDIMDVEKQIAAEQQGILALEH